MTTPSADNTNRSKQRLLAVAAICAVGIVLAIALWPSADEPVKQNGVEHPSPEFTPTAFLNAGPDAKHGGSKVCAECHKSNHASYMLTAHSKALTALDEKEEPADGSFQHAASGRNYRVYRKDGQMRHEELLRDEQGSEVARTDLPIKYLIGSGNFCRTYIAEVDGFLHESPITWYTSTKKWDMSPGYDFPQHWSFERPITVGCLNCHSGRIEPNAAVHKMALLEQAIGCERCHGPGSMHVERYRLGKPTDKDKDLTIVNPGHLPRPMLEAVCAECHLNAAASVPIRGRKIGDFRPGRPLEDFRIDYRFDDGSDQMTVVGHIEQLRRSKCYQKAESLSCITCHDPHAKEKPKDTVEFFRQTCIKCHETQACKSPMDARQKKADNCSACHMPRGDTDIPHVAFTHHRIGIHKPQPKSNVDRTPELLPIHDSPHLSELDRKRNLGLAYVLAARAGENSRYASAFRSRAKDLLEEVTANGLREGNTLQALAEIDWKSDPQRARRNAAAALETPDIEPDSRAFSLLILASIEFDEKNYTASTSLLKQATQLRRSTEDWRLMGVAQFLDRHPDQAIRTLEYARTIRPTRPDIHGGLSEVYRSIGDQAKAAERLRTAQWLEKNRQR